MKTIDIKALMMALNDRPIVYHKAYRKVTGSLTATILLGQLVYWWKKVYGRKFYKTDQDIMDETGLTASELKTAKAALKGLAFISITREGVPAKTYYEIDGEGLAEALTQTPTNASEEPNKIGGFRQTGSADFANQDERNSPNYTIGTRDDSKDDISSSMNAADKPPTTTDARSFSSFEKILKERKSRNDVYTIFEGQVFSPHDLPDIAHDRIAEQALKSGLREENIPALFQSILDNCNHFVIKNKGPIAGLKDIIDAHLIKQHACPGSR